MTKSEAKSIYDNLNKQWSDYESYVQAKKDVDFNTKQVALARQSDPNKVAYWQSELAAATAKLQSKGTPKKVTYEQVVAARRIFQGMQE